MWDYIEAHYADQIPPYSVELWPRYLKGEVTTPAGRFDVYKREEELEEWKGWSLQISQSGPPYQFILASDITGFRWEGTASVRLACKNCVCYEELDVTELSVVLGKPKQ